LLKRSRQRFEPWRKDRREHGAVIRATETQYRFQRRIERLLRDVADDAVAVLLVEDEQPANRIVDITRSRCALGAHFRPHVRDHGINQSRLTPEAANDASNRDARALRNRFERDLAEPVIPVAFDEGLHDAAASGSRCIGPGALAVESFAGASRIHVTQMRSGGP
jgi:hypothetical protein